MLRGAAWRARLNLLIVRFAYFYAITIGIVSLRYDFATRKIIRSPALKLYAFCMNCLIIGTSPLVLRFSMERIYGDNWFVHFIMALNVGLLIGAVAFTLVSRWSRERFAQHFVEQLAALEEHYFDGLPTDAVIECRYGRLLLVKCCCVVFLSAWAAITVLLSESYLWVALLKCFNVVNTLNVLQGVLLNYYMALLHLWKRFDLLNARLRELFTTLRCGPGHRTLCQLQHDLAVEVTELAQLHHQLARLTAALNAHHHLQIVALLLWRIGNHVALGYFTVLFFTSTIFVELNYMLVVFNIAIYFVLMLDLLMVDVVCSALEETQAEMAVIMRRFHEFAAMESKLEEACNLVSQQLRQHKLRIDIAGMFYLNKETSFAILAGIIQNTIVLVQWDLQYRRGT